MIVLKTAQAMFSAHFTELSLPLSEAKIQKTNVFRKKRLCFFKRKIIPFHKKVRTFSQKSTYVFIKKYVRFH